MSNKTIFISYSWKDDFITNRICDDLEYIGYHIIRDKKKMRYTDSILKYMERIRNEDYVLIIISENYLTSENCMRELIAFQKDDRWDILLPVITANTKLYELEDRVSYIKHWKEKIASQETLLGQLAVCDAAADAKRFQTVREISYNLANFMAKIVDILIATPEELWSNHYKEIDKKTKSTRNNKIDFSLKRISNEDLALTLKSHKENQPIDLSRYDLSNKGQAFNNITPNNFINLKYSALRNSCIINADFSGCNLQWVDFTATKFKYVSFCNADLRGANFTGIKYDKTLKIRDGNFSHAIMDDNFKKYIKDHGGIINED